MSFRQSFRLVSGAIPLLMFVYEHLSDACEARDLLSHCKNTHSEIYGDIKVEELLFRFHVQRILLPLIKSPELDLDVIDTVLSRADDPWWRDTDPDSALRRRLGEVHSRYIETLAGIPEVLHQLLVNCRYGRSPVQEKLQSLQVGKPSREELLIELRGKIQKLESLLAMSDEVAYLHHQIRPIVGPAAHRSVRGERFTSYGANAPGSTRDEIAFTDSGYGAEDFIYEAKTEHDDDAESVHSTDEAHGMTNDTKRTLGQQFASEIWSNLQSKLGSDVAIDSLSDAGGLTLRTYAMLAKLRARDEQNFRAAVFVRQSRK